MAILELVFTTLVVQLVSSRSIVGQYYKTPNDTQTCVNDLVEWCDGTKYPSEGGSMSMVAVTVADHRGRCQAVCTADAEGTNCTKNGSPWFSCSNQNKLFYKGNVLSKDSEEGADNETCKTADHAFNDLFVQNMLVDNTTLQKGIEEGMEQFFRAMEAMDEKIATMQRNLERVFGNGFPFGNAYPLIPSANRPEVQTDDPPTEDQREKERYSVGQ